jgi:dimethylargininase
MFDYTDAIVRSPAQSVVSGLRKNPEAVPDFNGVLREHAAYVAALRRTGLKVEVLPPLETFPDSVFVEDPALVLPNGAVLLRPGAPTRLFESKELRPVLNRRFHTLLELSDGEFADGGDVLVTPEIVYVGLSARTNRAGAEALLRLLARFGLKTRIVETPEGILHLKSGVSLLSEETLLANSAIAQSGMFGDFKIVELPPAEEHAVNAVRIRDTVLMNARFPRAIELIAKQGLHVIPLQIDEVVKLDAGLSCMSLRWFAAEG